MIALHIKRPGADIESFLDALRVWYMQCGFEVNGNELYFNGEDE